MIFAGLKEGAHGSDTRMILDDKTTRYCNEYIFSLTNINDHVARITSISSTVIEFRAGFKPKKHIFTDSPYSYVQKGGMSYTSSRPFCFDMQDKKDGRYQNGALYWHGKVRYQDVTTGNNYQDDFYLDLRMELDKSTDKLLETPYYILPAKQFDAQAAKAENSDG